MEIKTVVRSLVGLPIAWGFTLAMLPAPGYSQIEEIVVTARKRDETQLEIPISVSVFSQDALIDRGITTTEGLSDYSPGFTLQNLGQGGTSGRENPNIRFRGINVQQSSPASRAGAVFWDGAYISDGVGILPLIDLERAEVIKGPQTAFFGRNTFAGAVNFIPRSPGDEPSGIGSVEITPSEENGYTISGALGGPIGERWGLRLAATSENKGADYVYRDGSPLGTEETIATMGTLTFDATDRLRFRLSGFFVDSEDTRALISQVAPVAAGSCNRTFNGQFRNVGTGQIVGSFSTDLSQSPRATFCGSIPDWDDFSPNVPFEGIPSPGASSVFFSAGLDFVRTRPSEFDGDMISPPDGLGNNYRLWRYHLGGDYDLANGSTVSAFVSSGLSQHWSINDANYGTPILFGNTWFTGFAKEVEDTSFEARLTSAADQRLRYTVGLSYYNQESINAGFGLFSAFPPQLARANMDLQEGDNLGVFGSVDFDLNEAFTVSLEGRWNTDEQEITFEGFSGDDPANAVTGEKQDYSAFMPRVIISWQPPGRNLNLYASWSKSFLQGIPTDAATYALIVPGAGLNPATVGFFTPRQELNAIEVGIKQQIGTRLSYGVSVYTMDWDNQTFFDLAPVTFTPINLSGDSEYFGVDVEFDARVTDWFQLVGGFSYTDAEFTDFAGTGSVVTAVLAPGIQPGNQVSTIGNRPRYIPETTGSVSAVFDLGEVMGRGVTFRVDGIHTGDFFIDNFEWNQVDGYWKINLRASMDINDNLRAEVFGLNVTDDRSWTTAGGTTSITASPDRKTFGIPVRGVEWGLRLVASF